MKKLLTIPRIIIGIVIALGVIMAVAGGFHRIMVNEKKAPEIQKNLEYNVNIMPNATNNAVPNQMPNDTNVTIFNQNK